MQRMSFGAIAVLVRELSSLDQALAALLAAKGLEGIWRRPTGRRSQRVQKHFRRVRVEASESLALGQVPALATFDRHTCFRWPARWS